MEMELSLLNGAQSHQCCIIACLLSTKGVFLISLLLDILFIAEYDILVTNPPYSGEHKVNLLKFLAAHTNKASTNVKTSTTTNTTSANTPIQASNSDTAEVSTLPFALLLPVYVATKSYWKDFVQQQKSIGMDAFYILPPDYYEYSHPEGTGKDIPPFYSAWFLGGFAAGARER